MKNDLLVYPDTSNSAAPALAIRRRNAEGIYVPVANFTENVQVYVITNGKWIATTALSGTAATLFTIDDNNNISNGSTIASTVGGFLLSDDTFVGYDPSPLSDGNFTIRTYQYEASNNTWLNIPGTELVVRTTAAYLGDASTYRATDTHLVILDTFDPQNFTINIYERQADKSWKLVDSVPVNSTADQLPGGVSYNGETLVYARFAELLASNPSTYGAVYLYTKTANAWTYQRFDLLELGYKPVGLMGFSVIFIDADTMLVSVAFDGYSGQTIAGGKVLMLTRENGVWNPTLDLIGGAGLFGFGMAINNNDLILVSLTAVSGGYGVTFYTAPLCFSKPINATCNDKQVDSCTDLTATPLYTVNNPQCGAVTAKMNGFSLINNQELEVQFSFTKGFGPAVYCNATVTCPAPPVAPVANIQATPTKVSSAGALQLGITSLLTTIALAFM